MTLAYIKRKLRIYTSYWPKPIPTAQYDWAAGAEDWDLGMPYGHGATEREAIKCLIETTQWKRGRDR